MADPKPIIKKTILNEGTWSNDPDDLGGPTFCGISFNKNPQWKGWPILRSYLKSKKIPSTLAHDPKLLQLVYDFYIEYFWNKILGNQILSQAVAADLFDTAVNMGTSVSIRLAQKAMKIKETGIMDTTTLNAINKIK